MQMYGYDGFILLTNVSNSRGSIYMLIM